MLVRCTTAMNRGRCFCLVEGELYKAYEATDNKLAVFIARFNSFFYYPKEDFERVEEIVRVLWE